MIALNGRRYRRRKDRLTSFMLRVAHRFGGLERVRLVSHEQKRAAGGPPVKRLAPLRSASRNRPSASVPAYGL